MKLSLTQPVSKISLSFDYPLVRITCLLCDDTHFITLMILECKNDQSSERKTRAFNYIKCICCLHFIRTFNISYFKYLHKFNKQTKRKHDFFTNKQKNFHSLNNNTMHAFVFACVCASTHLCVCVCVCVMEVHRRTLVSIARRRGGGGTSEGLVKK